jgi:Zn finger protein HypA/HybF involved in hydrogenase expression
VIPIRPGFTAGHAGFVRSLGVNLPKRQCDDCKHIFQARPDSSACPKCQSEKTTEMK